MDDDTTGDAMGEDGDDDRGDDGVGGTDEVRWMTYAELGHARGISTASATRLAFRRKWRRQGDNEKTARVAVPIGETMPKTDKPAMIGVMSGVMSGDDIARAIVALENALTELHDRAESAEKRTDKAEIKAAEAEKRADRAEIRAMAAEAQAIASRERADAETAALRALAEGERGRADQAEGEVTTLRGQIKAERDLATATHNRLAVEVEAMREADRTRRAPGLVARLRAALRRE
jgi:hypothetical protein